MDWVKVIAVSGVIVLQCTPVWAQSTELDRAISRLRIQPTNPELSFDVSRLAAESGDFTVAIAALERILLLDPSLNNIRLELGVLYLRTGATDLAERNIAQAIQDPSAPPLVVERASEFLEIARRENESSFISGSARLTFGAQSNPLGVGSGSESDFFASLALGGTFRSDLGVQRGHDFVLDGALFLDRFSENSSENTDRLSVSPGFDFFFGQTSGTPLNVKLRGNATFVQKSGESFQTDLGVSVSAETRWENGLAPFMSFSFADQQFFDTSTETANSDKSGTLYDLRFGARKSLEGGRSLILSFSAADKTAAESHQSYTELGVAVSYLTPFGQRATEHGPWILAIDGSFTTRAYDAVPPLLIINEPDPEREITLGISGSLEVPVSDKAAVIGTLSYSNVDSNFTDQSYSNSTISISYARRF